MDEATASVDFATDEAIQAAIRTEFKSSTLLTIAHRLSSVIDYDRLLVLSDGKVAEFDTPIVSPVLLHQQLFPIIVQSQRGPAGRRADVRTYFGETRHFSNRSARSRASTKSCIELQKRRKRGTRRMPNCAEAEANIEHLYHQLMI